MHTGQTTRLSLLIRIRDPEDADAWRRFAELYAPLIERFVLKQGLQAADAIDVVQDVLLVVSRKIRNFDYNRETGRFRSWLFRVTRHRLLKQMERTRREPVTPGDSQIAHQLQELPAPDESDWNVEYQQRLFHWAAQRVRPNFREDLWQAFWLTAAESRPIAEVASELGLSTGAVYVARSRAIAAIRLVILEIES